MKVRIGSLSTLFITEGKYAKCNDQIDNMKVDILLKMSRSDFIDHFKNNLLILEAALSNEKLFEKFDDFVVSVLARNSFKACEILIASKKFNNKPIFDILIFCRDFAKVSATLPPALRGL
jgi:hypothetical protein